MADEDKKTEDKKEAVLEVKPTGEKIISDKDKSGEVRVDKLAKKKGKKKKGVIKLIKRGQAYIKATYNNTVVTLTDQNGNVLAWSSSGKCGFRGPKKSTPYAAGVVTREAVERAIQERGLKEVNVFVKGVGAGREAAVRALQANGLTVLLIKDVTPIPHNGCRPKKVRRV